MKGASQLHPRCNDREEAHRASQGARPLTRSGNRPYVPAVQGGAANTRTLAAEMPESQSPSDVEYTDYISAEG